jgi:hypothetical protein
MAALARAGTWHCAPEHIFAKAPRFSDILSARVIGIRANERRKALFFITSALALFFNTWTRRFHVCGLFLFFEYICDRNMRGASRRVYIRRSLLKIPESFIVLPPEVRICDAVRRESDDKIHPSSNARRAYPPP